MAHMVSVSTVYHLSNLMNSPICAPKRDSWLADLL
jgi:hypothetical protein